MPYNSRFVTPEEEAGWLGLLQDSANRTLGQMPWLGLPVMAARQAGEGLLAGAGFTGDVMQGKVDLQEPATTVEAIGHGLNAMSGGGGGALAAAGREGLSAGTFGGKLAAKALASKGEGRVLKAIEWAELADKEGMSPDSIWRETAKQLEGTPYTGVQKGVDGKWRFEIDDSPMSLNQDKVATERSKWAFKGGEITKIPHKVRTEYTGTTGDAIDHPALFNAYEGLGQAPMHVRPTLRGARGGYAPGQDQFYLAHKAYNKQKQNRMVPISQMEDVALHELQHGIQAREGFTPGSAPSYAAQEVMPALSERLLSLRVRAERIAKGESGLPPLTKAEANELERLKVAVDRVSGEQGYNYPNDFHYKLYHHNAGEVEARNVAARRKMNSYERRATPPWKTEDYPRESQLPTPSHGFKGTQLDTAVKGKTANQVFPQYAKEYPPIPEPELAVDKKSGKEYLAKGSSPEIKAFSKARKQVQQDIDAGNYKPFFDVAKRYDADPKEFPEFIDTSDIVRKSEKGWKQMNDVANNPAALQKLSDAFDRGYLTKENSGDWYLVGQLLSEFKKEYGQKKGAEMFKERFADAMAATTGGASPTDNLVMAVFGNYLKSHKMATPENAYSMPYPVGGRFVTGNMAQYDKMIRKGEGVTPANPKRYNFSGAFQGNKNANTLDEQMMSPYKMGMPPAGAYGHFQQATNALSKKKGVDPRGFQDVTWAGLKEFEGKPMIQIINEAIERTARLTGQSPQDVVRYALVRGERPLYMMGMPVPQPEDKKKGAR
jgi:hypothetical protein